MLNKLYLTAFLSIILLCNHQLNAQTNAAPDGIIFQAVATDPQGNPASGRTIYIKDAILQSTVNGQIVYTETFKVTASNSGVFTIVIGKGQKISGPNSINNLDWTAGPYFLNIKAAVAPSLPLADWNADQQYIDMGTSQFWSVPFALYASNVAGFDLKLNIADTTNMLKQYLRKSDTASLSSRIDASKITITQEATRAIASEAFKANATDVITSLSLKENTANKSTSVIADAISDTKYPTVKSVKTYIDAQIFSNPQGTQGLQGATGATGATGVTGAQGPIGNKGPVGDKGLVGDKGATGDQGPIGLIGATGPQGIQGIIGLTGSIGATGLQGPIGLTGANGSTGPQGIQGLTGLTGSTGATGSQGPIGLTGANGATGSQGPVGLTGSTGPQGIQGLTGLTGSIGATGSQGLIGLNGTNGATGSQGPIGLTGANGSTGPQGIQGLIGLTGSTGATGSQGIQGLTGLTGSTGATGSQGLIGLTGTNGAMGSQGPIGLTGSTGATGPQGIQGLIGLTGSTGAIGSQGPIGLTGSTGSTGPQGIQGNIGLTGSSGASGSQGLQGLAGATGAAGSDAVITMIAIAGSSNSNGATISSGNLSLTPADGTNGGIVTNGNQTFSGNKTFSGNILSNSQVGIGTNSPSASAKLDVTSTTQGFLPPRMTAANRDAIATPAAGLMIYCTNCGAGEWEGFNGTAWTNIVGGTKAVPLAIGQSYQGGIIAYILISGDPGYDTNTPHGLIAATVDQSTSIQWFNGSYTTTGATGVAIGTGLANTNAIITNQGATSTNYAAGLARAYTGGGYSDWYLPSKDELNKLYLNKTVVGGFGGYAYWNSTEFNNNNYAWYEIFPAPNGGIQSADSKNTTYNVRAIRSF